jgi:hypothetical protein
LKLFILIVACFAAMHAQTKEQPKTVPLTPDQKTAVTDIFNRQRLLNEEYARVQQEIRAVQAESKLLEQENQAMAKSLCDAAGGLECRPQLDGAPDTWAMVVTAPKPAASPAVKPESKPEPK